jgi:hypothetical protein
MIVVYGFKDSQTALIFRVLPHCLQRAGLCDGWELTNCLPGTAAG